MAAHSNRSPSPLSSRPINPNPKNPEINSTIRRSFTGNSKPSLLTNQRRFDPITPANSPSDFARRRPSVVKNCEEKENDEKDCVLKASKLHSPAKGFMAPTISAASKLGREGGGGGGGDERWCLKREGRQAATCRGEERERERERE